MQDKIKIKGAREHNLKNVDLELPRNKMIVFTGLSGSGKSSLAFDTIFAEGQRRYVESLSAYARQFLGGMQKPDVDEIEGLSPAISIDQKAHTANPRSTVATITEVYDYLRVLYARIGQPYCPLCETKIEKMTIDEIRNIIKPVGLSPAKSKGIWNLSKILIDKYDGNVPEDINKLEELPSVGHKTASVVMSQAFGQPAFPVDTHVYRITGRVGLRPEKISVEKAHPHLESVFPPETYYAAHLNIIRLGREICKARKANCAECPLLEICDYGQTQKE